MHRSQPSVRFHHATRVIFVTPHSDMHITEKNATWYSREEQLQMKVDALDTVDLCRSGQPIDENKDSSRGLEHLVSEGAQQRRHELRQSIKLAILEEQRSQRKIGIFDPEYISTVASSFSIRSTAGAIELGATDAAIAFVMHCHEVDSLTQLSPMRSTKNHRILEFYQTGRKQSDKFMNSTVPDLFDRTKQIEATNIEDEKPG